MTWHEKTGDMKHKIRQLTVTRSTDRAGLFRHSHNSHERKMNKHQFQWQHLEIADPGETVIL